MYDRSATGQARGELLVVNIKAARACRSAPTTRSSFSTASKICNECVGAIAKHPGTVMDMPEERSFDGAPPTVSAKASAWVFGDAGS
jgi:hypothetical protein